MTGQQRKTIKVTLPADVVDDFDRAKARAEKEIMMTLSDAQFASRVVANAVSLGQAAVVFSNGSHWVVGLPGSEARKVACYAAYLLEMKMEDPIPAELAWWGNDTMAATLQKTTSGDQNDD